METISPQSLSRVCRGGCPLERGPCASGGRVEFVEVSSPVAAPEPPGAPLLVQIVPEGEEEEFPVSEVPQGPEAPLTSPATTVAAEGEERPQELLRDGRGLLGAPDTPVPRGYGGGGRLWAPGGGCRPGCQPVATTVCLRPLLSCKNSRMTHGRPRLRSAPRTPVTCGKGYPRRVSLRHHHPLLTPDPSTSGRGVRHRSSVCLCDTVSRGPVRD